jgi:hypothetical protein
MQVRTSLVDHCEAMGQHLSFKNHGEGMIVLFDLNNGHIRFCMNNALMAMMNEGHDKKRDKNLYVSSHYTSLP